MPASVTPALTASFSATQVYIIEANPRASRTVPFVAKAIGHPIAKYASLLMSGKTLAEPEFTEEPKLEHVAVKEAVLPFEKFPGTFKSLIACCEMLTCSQILDQLLTTAVCATLPGTAKLLVIC